MTVVILSNTTGMCKMRIMLQRGPDRKHAMWQKPANGEAMQQKAFLWGLFQSKTLLVFYGHRLISSSRSRGHGYQGQQLACYLGLWSGGQAGGGGINQGHTASHRDGTPAFLESHSSNQWLVLPAPPDSLQVLFVGAGWREPETAKWPSQPDLLTYLVINYVRIISNILRLVGKVD